MAKYIECEAAVSVAMQYCPDDDGVCSKADADLREMLDEIEAIPAADVAPVRHGYWRWYDTTHGGIKLYVCSLCDGDSKTENEIKRCAYCPNCGALMYKDGDGK